MSGANRKRYMRGYISHLGHLRSLLVISVISRAVLQQFVSSSEQFLAVIGPSSGMHSHNTPKHVFNAHDASSRRPKHYSISSQGYCKVYATSAVAVLKQFSSSSKQYKALQVGFSSMHARNMPPDVSQTLTESPRPPKPYNMPSLYEDTMSLQIMGPRTF
jgi:hypothetical protein